MATREEIREGIPKLIGDMYYEKYGKEMVHTEQDDEFVERLLTYLDLKGAELKVKCPECEWSEFGGEDTAGMTPCLSCNSTGYIYKPLIGE